MGVIPGADATGQKHPTALPKDTRLSFILGSLVRTVCHVSSGTYEQRSEHQGRTQGTQSGHTTGLAFRTGWEENLTRSTTQPRRWNHRAPGCLSAARVRTLGRPPSAHTLWRSYRANLGSGTYLLDGENSTNSSSTHFQGCLKGHAYPFQAHREEHAQHLPFGFPAARGGPHGASNAQAQDGRAGSSYPASGQGCHQDGVVTQAPGGTGPHILFCNSSPLSIKKALRTGGKKGKRKARGDRKVPGFSAHV